MAVSANKLELLQIADAVAREKSIDRSIVISAMEDAIAKIDAQAAINELFEQMRNQISRNRVHADAHQSDVAARPNRRQVELLIDDFSDVSLKAVGYAESLAGFRRDTP